MQIKGYSKTMKSPRKPAPGAFIISKWRAIVTIGNGDKPLEGQ